MEYLSLIGFAAIFYSEDVDGTGGHAPKTDAPIADAKAMGTRKLSFQSLNISLPGFSVANERNKNAHGSLALDPAELSTGDGGPNKLQPHSPNSWRISSCGTPSPRAMEAAASASSVRCRSV